jgi:hypothetical protein
LVKLFFVFGAYVGHWSLAIGVGKNRERVCGWNNPEGEGTGGGVASGGKA